MTPTRKFAAVLLAVLVGAAAAAFSVRAQPQGQIPMPAQRPTGSAPAMNPNLVVLDAAHGGPDNGAVLGDHVFEKDINMAVADRLKAALTAAGFTVVETRTADSGEPLTTDQRAEIANRTHALACIVLHATTTGSGVHIYTSALQPPAASEEASEGGPSAFVPISWETAQAGFVRQSLALANDVNDALGRDHLPALVGQAPLRPLGNLMCPAVAIELAPLPAPGVGATPVSDASYQQQVATTLTTALRAWRDNPGDQASSATTPDAQKGTQ